MSASMSAEDGATSSDTYNAVERRLGLLDALSRIRHLKDSKLENQRAPAQLLVAIEATLAERAAQEQQETGPTQYFLALESLLSAEEPGEDVHASSVYLLSLVLPYVAPGVVRAKSLALLSAVAAPLAEPHGASEHMNARIRSALGVVEALLEMVPVKDRTHLERERTWLTVWDLVLSLCMDARPKVRRRAHDLVRHILGLPVWSHDHPYASRTMAWAARTLQHVAEARGGPVTTQGGKPTYDKKSGQARHAKSAAAARQQAASEGAASSGIWVCQLLQGLVALVPPKTTATLVPALLLLPALQNPFLTVAVYDVFAALFRSPRAEAMSTEAMLAASTALEQHARDVTLLAQTVSALLDESAVPASTDVQTLPSYMGVLESCMVTYSAASPTAAWALVPALWQQTWHLALSAQSDASRSSPSVRVAGRTLLQALVRYCVPEEAVAEALTASTSPLRTMLDSVKDALGTHALRYAHARADILPVLSSCLQRLRYPLEPRQAPPAEALLMDQVVHVASLRTQRDFDARAEADAVLGTAVEVCGPARILAVLPLQLLDDEGRPNMQGTGRAWMLPLLRAHITNTNLQHFVEAMVPLSEALFELRVRAEQPTDGTAPRPVEAKVMEALIEQIWACFPGYCDLARDVPTALTPRVLELLVQVLRTQRALRPSVLKGLEWLVQRTESLVASQAPADQLQRQFGVDQAQGQATLAHLRSLAGVLLASLFNLLSELPAQERAYVMECIRTYLAILDAPSIAQTFSKVAAMLTQALQTYEPSMPAPGMPEPNSPRYVPPVPHTMMDLLLALVPHLKKAEAIQLVDMCAHVLPVADSSLQKKAYRALARLLTGDEAEALRSHFGTAALVSQWLTLDVQPGAVRDRLQLLLALLPHWPNDQLGLLGSVVPEAVLGTKEANQGAREAAYDLLVEMGHRMAQGGTIHRAQAGAANAETASVDASVQELVMMVAAGLAGASPRMIGASITALARLLYEFHTTLPADTVRELLATMLVFLESTNREIVKGALGFCKVALVALPAPDVESTLPTLVPALLHVRHVHKNHFKGRVRHLIERLLRRFGEKAIEVHVDAENQRLLANIRKRKERAKRRRAQASTHEGEEETDWAPAKSVGVDAFEEALYGSASESESDDDEDAEEKATRPKARLPNQGRQRRAKHREDDTYLLEDNDTPMNLLDASTVSAIRSHVRAKPRREPGQEAKSFQVDDMGRLHIQDEAAAAAADGPEAAAMATEGHAYMDKSLGVDGFTHRGRGGAVKFNKNNKRTRAQERRDDEEEEAETASHAPRRPKRGKQAIGSEFRARRAEGDVQKNGMSPYAYVPLSSVAGKRKGKPAAKLAITGKHKAKRT